MTTTSQSPDLGYCLKTALRSFDSQLVWHPVLKGAIEDEGYGPIEAAQRADDVAAVLIAKHVLWPLPELGGTKSYMYRAGLAEALYGFIAKMN